MDPIETLFGLLETIGNNNNLDKEEIMELTLGSYEELIGKFRILISLSPEIAKKFAEDIAPVATGIMTLEVCIGDNPEFQKVLEDLNRQKACQEMNVLNAYIKAGFSREEAVILLARGSHNKINWLEQTKAVTSSK
jgi:hypothetical protein